MAFGHCSYLISFSLDPSYIQYELKWNTNTDFVVNCVFPLLSLESYVGR